MRTAEFGWVLPAMLLAAVPSFHAVAQNGTATGKSAGVQVNYLFPTATSSPPSTPGDFRITDRVGNVLSLAWSESEPASKRKVAGYQLYRNGVAIGTTTGTQTTVSISPAGELLEFYAVRSFDDVGNLSPASGEIIAPHGDEIDLSNVQIETKRIFAKRKNLALRGFIGERRYRKGVYTYELDRTVHNYGYNYTTTVEDRQFSISLDSGIGKWASTVSGSRTFTFVELTGGASPPPVIGTWMASASDPLTAEYWENGALLNSLELTGMILGAVGARSDTEAFDIGANLGDVSTWRLSDELTDEEFRAGIAADYAVGENLLPTMGWNSLVAVSCGVVIERRGRGDFFEFARRLEYEEDDDTIEIIGGQYRFKIPGTGVTTLRWAEVTTPFDGSEPVFVYREEIVDTGIAEGFSQAYTLLPPSVPGTSDIVLLSAGLAIRTPSQTATAISTRRLFKANAIFTGEAAELLITLGSGFGGRQQYSTIMRFSGAGETIKLFGIDSAIEERLGIEAAIEQGIEITTGTDLVTVPHNPGLTEFSGWKLIALGRAPGVVEMELQVMMALDAQPSFLRSTLTVYPTAGVAVDADRDGVIRLATEGDSDATTPGSPWRFWVNDDDDAGDVKGTDTPSLGSANSADDVVNGTRDLIDFFPVYLDLRGLLTASLPGGPFKFKLKQVDGGLNFVYTNLTRERALAYHRELLKAGFGDQFGQDPGSAATHQITATGVELSPVFLAGIRDSDWGVVLIEGRKPTTQPLVISVEEGATPIAEIKLELRVSNVEEMFRHLNLRRFAKNYDDSPALPSDPGLETRLADPGEALPDATTNGKYFVFVHGYNVNAHKARGWQSEIFKRLFVMGSHARFVGVSWYGSTGLDYHKAVFHSFQAGDILGSKLALPAGADVTIAAHSLGNMLVSHAIQSGGFAPTRYYMINAAVPIEAYDLNAVDDDQRKAMIEHDWKNREARFYAANWHNLFGATPSDHRNGLTWKNRFVRVRRDFESYNFYSLGEDVVENSTTDTASVAETLLRQGFNFSRGAWVAQELVKGVSWTTSLADFFMIRGQAGWKRDLWYLGVSPSEIANQELVTRPFFSDFKEKDLIDRDVTIASAKAGKSMVQYDLLARGLPSLSYAAAANRISSFELLTRDFNMEKDGRTQNQWPLEGHDRDPKATGRWLHSDFKDVALPYVFQMYAAMIEKGLLR